jgi:hypothetical protein
MWNMEGFSIPEEPGSWAQIHRWGFFSFFFWWHWDLNSRLHAWDFFKYNFLLNLKIMLIVENFENVQLHKINHPWSCH